MQWIRAHWPVPSNVIAGCTVRNIQGSSQGSFSKFNLAAHVNDDPEAVKQNRVLLETGLNLPVEPAWLQQVHGTRVVNLEDCQTVPEADGSYTSQVNRVCVVMTADCLPVLFCNEKGTWVAALHAGWRGLANGIIESGLRQAPQNEKILVWLGPAISAEKYEVGDEVYSAFIKSHEDDHACFRAARKGHWYCDMYALARKRLERLGVQDIFGGEYCTYTDSERFYSFRRDGETGRMASLIWIQPT